MNFVQFITPLNLAEEKEKFFASQNYHPQFIYDWNDQSFHAKYHNLAAAVIAQDTTKMVEYAQQIFETYIDPEILHTAREAVANAPTVLPEQPLSDLVIAFQKALHFLDLAEYQVELVDKHGFNIRPSISQKKVVISKHANLDFFSIDGEVKHELLHVIRAENTVFNNIGPSRNYLPTEEGFASYAQDYVGENGTTSLFQHAAEYVVTEVAQHGSLREVVNTLQQLGFSDDLAWKRGVRHKFGWQDTARPGDIFKPAMYFYHQQKIRQLSSTEKYRLLSGKIAISDLHIFPKYIGRVDFEKIQKFFNF